MKIEKINDNQIKCTLTRSDLASRQLRISEIAYGTEKANGLFRDMMDQASMELGLEFNDFPVSIEAIPVSMDCIILMITKLEEPEEIDTAVDFSGLAVLKELFNRDPRDFTDSLPFTEDTFPEDLSSDSFLSLEHFQHDPRRRKETGNDCLFSFPDLETAAQFARQVSGIVFLQSSLYKASDGSRYYLYLVFPASNSGDYAYTSTVALEFGVQEPSVPSRMACIREHSELLLKDDAVQKLSDI